MNELLLSGYENIIEGLLVPFVISLAGSVVRFALWGWDGYSQAVATMCVSCFCGICAHWLMASLAVPSTINAAVVSLVSLYSRELLQTIFSPETLHSLRRRIQHEILYRGRKQR